MHQDHFLEFVVDDVSFVLDYYHTQHYGAFLLCRIEYQGGYHRLCSHLYLLELVFSYIRNLWVFFLLFNVFVYSVIMFVSSMFPCVSFVSFFLTSLDFDCEVDLEPEDCPDLAD